jgi:hypothetical protein
MVAIRQYPHLLLDLHTYRSPCAASGGGGDAVEPTRVSDRTQHYRRIQESLESAIEVKRTAIEEFETPAEDAQVHLSVSARTDVGVLTGESFQNPEAALQLLSVKGTVGGRRPISCLRYRRPMPCESAHPSVRNGMAMPGGRQTFLFCESIDRFFQS